MKKLLIWGIVFLIHQHLHAEEFHSVVVGTFLHDADRTDYRHDLGTNFSMEKGVFAVWNGQLIMFYQEPWVEHAYTLRLSIFEGGQEHRLWTSEEMFTESYPHLILVVGAFNSNEHPDMLIRYSSYYNYGSAIEEWNLITRLFLDGQPIGIVAQSAYQLGKYQSQDEVATELFILIKNSFLLVKKSGLMSTNEGDCRPTRGSTSEDATRGRMNKF